MLFRDINHSVTYSKYEDKIKKINRFQATAYIRINRLLHLLQQYHFLCLNKGARLQMVEVDPSRYIFTHFITCIPAYTVIPGRGEAVDKSCNFASHYIVNNQTHAAVLRQVVVDRCDRVERVGVIVMQCELSWYRHDLMDRVSASDHVTFFTDELVTDVDRYV